jgi:hypothetical protein
VLNVVAPKKRHLHFLKKRIFVFVFGEAFVNILATFSAQFWLNSLLKILLYLISFIVYNIEISNYY